MSRPLLIPLCLLLGACSHPDPFADWPDVSALRAALPPAPVIKADFPEGMAAARRLLDRFYMGGDGEEQYPTWLDSDDYMTEEWVVPGTTVADMPFYVTSAADAFLAWHRQRTWGSVTMKQKRPKFLLIDSEALSMFLQVYGEEPGMREALYHLAQVMWNQGFHLLQEMACRKIWKGLAADQDWWTQELPSLRERYPLSPTAGKRRLVSAFLTWHDEWPMAPAEARKSVFPDGVSSAEEAEIARILTDWLAQPGSQFGPERMQTEDLSFLRGTTFVKNLPIWQSLGEEPWLPWMTGR